MGAGAGVLRHLVAVRAAHELLIEAAKQSQKLRVGVRAQVPQLLRLDEGVT